MWQALPGTRDVKMSEPQTLTLGGLRAGDRCVAGNYSTGRPVP